MTTTPNLGSTRTTREFGIDSRIGADTTRSPVASEEDPRSQAIHKLYQPSSLDSKARHGLLVFAIEDVREEKEGKH